MPAISKIRFTNVVYENGEKRYNDDIFEFDGYNGAILLENGGGKTVYVQTALQAILPHVEVADRKIKNTLALENSTAHIAIEWILNERPRRYGVTVVTLFMNKGTVDSYKYAYEYLENDDSKIEKIPFVRESINGNKRPSTKEEMSEYYSDMSQKRINAHTFKTIKDYHEYIEDNFKIIPSEWRKIALINGAEGGVEAFFDACKNTGQLVDNLLIPTVEEALAGDGTKDFVEIFEKQREHFKKYRQLNSRIEESKKVEAQINLYAEVFQEYDKVKLEEIEAKQDLKAIYNFEKNENEVIKDKLENNNKEYILVTEEENSWKQKNLSYNLKMLENNMDKEDKSFQEVSQNYEKLVNTKREKEKKYSSLQIAKYKQDIKSETENIEYLNKEVKKLDKDEAVVDISEQLDENSKKLRGYYLDKEEKLNKEKNLIDGQINNIKIEIKNCEDELKKAKNKETDLEKSKSSLEGKIEWLTKDINNIKKSILNNPSQDNVKEQVSIWKNRIIELEKRIHEHNMTKNELVEEQQILKVELTNSRKDIELLNRKQLKLEEEIKNIDEIKTDLLNRIKEFRSSWFSFDLASIYSKQNTIITQVESKLEKLREEKEKCIFYERLAHKWVDEYNDNEYYTADYSLEKYIKQWRNDFNYIESGTKYIQRASKNNEKSEEELLKLYPYWTISIVTSDSEVEKVKDKIHKQLNDISHPIIIMTEKEAKNKIQGDTVLEEKKILFPLAWAKNIAQDNFESWKREIIIKAQETTKLREIKEGEFGKCKELLKSVREFYDKYSYEYYNEICKNEKSLKENIEAISKEIKNNENRLIEIEHELSKNHNDISEFSGEQQTLQGKVSKGQECLIKNNEKEENEVQIKSIINKIELALEEIRMSERQLEENKDIENEIGQELNLKINDINNLKSEELYEEVKSVTPIYSDLSKKLLKDQRKNLKDDLENKQKDRRFIEEQLKNAINNKKSSEKHLSNFIKSLEVTIDENLEFPLSGEIEIARLFDELQELKEPIIKLKDELDKSKAKFDKSKNTYELRKEDYLKEYDEIIVFMIELEQIKSILMKENKGIEKKKEFIFKEKERLKKEEEDIEDTIKELDICNGKYSYLSEEIKLNDLSDELKQKLPYKRQEVINAAKKKIEEVNKLLDKKTLQTEEQKKIFIKFCDSEIIDVKLKDMAASGVKFKNTLNDIEEWKKRLNERISRTIQIALDDIREHDKEVQQFINQLHSYLVTMVQELKVIPKKTRIKVEDEWKEVFIFNVPEWDEKEGKEELARHIDWMLNQLESDRFRDENGIELPEQAKKEIEKWLKSKQLLQIVMKQNTIKVKCRKVTNDGKMRSAPFSWEVSNSWSGGEKWSKNMTLFLGILNYLAEKRKQIIPTNKHYRTVIVDNPFGKASSDHVLDPVFFIAEQLGFQIIALTAHAEGKFIRTYFPIVHSLRLRNSKDSSTQIMTKEKEIKTAYFKDSDPETLLRLGQLQQIGFDYDTLV